MSISHIPEDGLFLCAALLCIGAARSEAAAAGRINGTGNVSLQPFDFSRVIRIGHRNGRQQCFRVWMLRILKELIRTAKLNDVAQIHHHDAIAQVLNDAQIVGNKDVRQAVFLLQILQQVQDLRLN